MSYSSVLLKLSCAFESPGDLVKIHVLIPSVCLGEVPELLHFKQASR